MTLVWTLVADVLYAEIAMVALLLLPIRPQRWQTFFESRILSSIRRQRHFYAILAGLAIFVALHLVEAMREIMQQGNHQNIKADMLLARAQRNLCITGFILFLLPVIYRLISLILSQARLMGRIGTNAAESNIKKVIELIVLFLLVYVVKFENKMGTKFWPNF